MSYAKLALAGAAGAALARTQDEPLLQSRPATRLRTIPDFSKWPAAFSLQSLFHGLERARASQPQP